MSNKIRVIYFGTWGLGYAGLQALTESDKIEVVKVYSKWDDNYNDKYYNLVYSYCLRNNINVFNADRKYCSVSDFVKDVLSNENIDFLVSCSFDRIFSNKILKLPKIKAINVHPSYLPKYRGPFPLQNAIIENDNFTGVSIHELVQEIDAGDIFIQENSIELTDECTFNDLMERQKKLAKKLIKDFFSNYHNLISNKKPQKSIGSFAPRLDFKFGDNDTLKVIKEKYIVSKLNYQNE